MNAEIQLKLNAKDQRTQRVSHSLREWFRTYEFVNVGRLKEQTVPFPVQNSNLPEMADLDETDNVQDHFSVQSVASSSRSPSGRMMVNKFRAMVDGIWSLHRIRCCD